MKITSQFQHGPVQGFKFGSDPLGKPTLFSIVYFVDGLLIDTGHPNMRKEILETTSQLPVEQIFLTHHHEDHSGNAPQLKAQFNCQVYTSPETIEVMKAPPKISFAQHILWGDRPPNTDLLPIEGQVKTPNFTFDMHFIPGHAVDMYCLHEPNQGWLFSADLWVNHYIRYFMRSEYMAEQIKSMRKILKLDFEQMFCGHNPQFEGGKPKLQKKLEFMEQFYEDVASRYKRGMSASQIMKDMNLKEKWFTRIMSHGHLSSLNMVKSVIRDEKQKAQKAAPQKG